VSCNQCTIGTYANIEGLAECFPCESGTFSNSMGMISCQTCPAGTYSPVSGLSTCYPCPYGTVQKNFQSCACETCNPGTHVPFMNKKQSCDSLKCPTNTIDHDQNPLTPCVNCGNMSLTLGPGQVECISDSYSSAADIKMSQFLIFVFSLVSVIHLF
jgi:hypothetical protein